MIKECKQAIKWLIAHLPGKRAIIFESVPNYSDNSWAVFEEMMRRGLDEKYNMYWWVNKKGDVLSGYPSVKYLHFDSFWSQKWFRWITLRAKALVCCNTFLTEEHPWQKAFYLTHGTALKNVKDYYVPGDVSYMLVASEHVRPTMARDFHMAPESVVALGYPRNDVMTQPERDLQNLFPGEYRKVIVWYPTFRQHKGGAKTGAANGLPVLHNSADAIELNEHAKENGVLIVVKPHFAQDISYITAYNLSNIRFIDDSFFSEQGLSSYEFVSSCDALITDYSSIYFDYLLRNKPIAVIWEDIEEYRRNPGFAMDPDVYMRGSHKIYTLADFSSFLSSLAKGEDPYRQERNALNTLMNYSCDGKNAQRVADFIIEKARL